jgi:acetoin utilization deacetylase AcuC-like enzyme
MSRTGIFFNYQDGERLRDFPQALEGILGKDNVFFYDAFYPFKPPSAFELEPIPVDLLHRVHTPAMIRRVQASEEYEGALYSAAGTVAAARRAWLGEIDNAFVFTGYGDHHAGRDFFGGGCYLNGAALAIHEVRHRFQVRKVAIVDTDAHHGNGTWDIFGDDPDVMYVCLCAGSSFESNNNINVEVRWKIDDDGYIDLARSSFIQRVKGFEPECIFWNWGYDGTQGDYGDIGLTAGCHARLARELKESAERLCSGRLIVILCGGGRRDLAQLVIPQVVGTLAED